MSRLDKDGHHSERISAALKCCGCADNIFIYFVIKHKVIAIAAQKGCIGPKNNETPCSETLRLGESGPRSSLTRH